MAFGAQTKREALCLRFKRRGFSAILKQINTGNRYISTIFRKLFQPKMKTFPAHFQNFSSQSEKLFQTQDLTFFVEKHENTEFA